MAHKPVSFRLPPETLEALNRNAKKTGKKRTAYLIEAINEKIIRES